jgi:hypothetical protein
MTRAAVAKKLKVSRPTVAGWFLALEAIQKGQVSASGRVFRYTDQTPGVQAAIATALNLPVDQLRAESLGQRANRPATDVLEAAGELLDVGRLILGEIGSGRTPQPQSLAHRVAEVVESVTGVPTLTVPEPRGNDRANPPYQYQLVVFSAERAGPDNGNQDETSRMAEIAEALRAAALPVYWEHGVKTPDVQLVHSGAQEWKRLGSLVIPHIAMSHVSSVGLLVPPNRGNLNQRHLRYATIVTPPYGGSDPVGGYLSAALAAGHIHALDVVRAFHDARAKRDDDRRLALISQATLLDTGYAVQKTLHLLQDGVMPGAWIMSMETELPHVLEPLAEDLVRVKGPLMLVRLGPQWQRMAAWRLAAARLNTNGRKDDAELPWSSDQVDLRAPTSPRDLEVLRHHFDIAQEEEMRLAAWDELMVDMARERRQRAERGQTADPTFEVVLDPLPEDGSAIRFDSGTLEPVSGAERFEGMVVFPDAVDGLMDAWVRATVNLLDELARLAGYEDASTLTGRLNDGPVRRVIEHRRGAAAS